MISTVNLLIYGPRVFLDASYAIALVSPNDPHHIRAVQISNRLEELSVSMVTTVGILLEIGNALSRQQFRNEAVNLLTALDRDPSVEVVPLSDALYDRAFHLFRNRTDKEWGLVDCASFVVMGDQGLTGALTADNHFRQAGFQALMLDRVL